MEAPISAVPVGGSDVKPLPSYSGVSNVLGGAIWTGTPGGLGGGGGGGGGGGVSGGGGDPPPPPPPPAQAASDIAASEASSAALTTFAVETPDALAKIGPAERLSCAMPRLPMQPMVLKTGSPPEK